MKELTRALTADSAHAPPSRILESLDEALAQRMLLNASHTIYQELWHIAFWQQRTLDWIAGIETASPLHNDLSFPDAAQIAAESWERLQRRFFASLDVAVAAAEDAARLDVLVRCPSPPGNPIRVMSVREQLESLAAHNAYHFGRIVMLRQLSGAWPPPSGGFTW